MIKTEGTFYVDLINRTNHRITFSAIVMFLFRRLRMAASAPRDNSNHTKFELGVDCSSGCLHETSKDKQRPSRSPPLYSTASNPCGRCSGACDPKMACMNRFSAACSDRVGLISHTGSLPPFEFELFLDTSACNPLFCCFLIKTRRRNSN